MAEGKRASRVVLITLDGVGIGALPDAGRYGDQGANTLQHVAERCGGLALPNLGRMGLGNLLSLAGVPPAEFPLAARGRMQECSAGKDTTTGHWEIAGLILSEAFPTYPDGFPPEIIAAFRRETGLEPLGNVAASGTEIIRRLGREHMATGRPIIYTSVDSVFQIAAHEEVIPLDRLYGICRLARRILNPYRIGRVIARPFTGSGPENFQRTPHRHDFAIPPTGTTVLDLLRDGGYRVFGVGKIHDIFAGRGITHHVTSESNADGMEKTLAALEEVDRGLIFTNLVDFDMLFGHRCDTQGFGRALEAFDRWLPHLTGRLAREDLLIITADHGCDPTVQGTDHTREFVPLLVWRPGMKRGVDLGLRHSFADVGATIAECFGLATTAGESFWPEVAGTGAEGRGGARKVSGNSSGEW